MVTLLQQIQQTVITENLLQKGDRVLVALSGGADSVALLKALWLLQEEWGLSLTAAHLHHGIRGEEADADLALCERLCQSLNIPLITEHKNLPALCKQTGEGEEECGRRVRYEFFSSIPDMDKIATAHTANDNAETLLLHLSRGAGLQGLRGILPKRGKVIRPLINCTRQQVEAFCREQRLPFSNDSTNKDTRYRRNFMRHKVLPLLEQINPAFVESVGRCANANQKDFDYLRLVGEQLLQKATTQNGYSLPILQQAHPVELHYALQLLIQQQNLKNPSAVMWKNLTSIIQKGEGECTLSQGLSAFAFQGTFWLEQKDETPKPAPLSVGLEQKTYQLGKKQVTLEIKTLTPSEITQKVCNFLTYQGPDGDKIGTSLFLRTRREGDTITLAHRGCTKSLKKLMNEMKIPQNKRNRLVVLADEKGVLWVEGIGCDARCTPTQQTKRQLIIGVIE